MLLCVLSYYVVYKENKPCYIVIYNPVFLILIGREIDKEKGQ